MGKLKPEKAAEMLKNPPYGRALTNSQKKYFSDIVATEPPTLPNVPKMGGWLNKYNDGGPVQENYNDAKVSTPPGFVGMGYDTKGRNYSPAWGGQFQDGGEILGKTFLQPNNPRLPKGWNPKEKGYSTEYSTTVGKDGEYYLVPGFKQGKLVSDPEREFHNTGELLGGPFKTIQSAQNFADRRHKYVEQGKPIPSPMKTYDEFAMGGGIPGAVGFTYARVAGSAPANGKYAKKTLASAQNGKYINDIKKKTKGIERELTEKYIEPQVDKAFEKARQKGIGYGLHNGPYDAVRHAASASKVASSLPIVGMPIANILGAAHELSAGRGDLKELGSDLYNNFIGSVIGSIPFVSDDKKLDLIIAAQKNGILSTMSNKNTDVSDSDRVIKNLSEKKQPTLKKRGFQNGGEMKYYQEGLDFKPKTISKNGAWLDKYK